MYMVDELEFERLKKKEKLLKEIQPLLKDLLNRKTDTNGAYLHRVVKTVQSVLRSIKAIEGNTDEAAR